MSIVSRLADKTHPAVAAGAAVLGAAGLILLSTGQLNRYAGEALAHRSATERVDVPFRDREGGAVGELRITYDDTVRENQNGTIKLEYAVLGSGWKWRAAGAALAVSASSTAFDFDPSPPRHSFNFGKPRDGTVWLLAPKKEGAYNVRLTVEANGLTPDIRGVPAEARIGDTLVLPVRVVTQYGLSGSTQGMVAAFWTVLSFVLTLPAAALIVGKLAGRGSSSAKPPAKTGRSPSRRTPSRTTGSDSQS